MSRALSFFLVSACAFAGTANITITPSTTYQTWHYNMAIISPTPAFDSVEPDLDPSWNTSVKSALLDQLVNQLGINTAQLTVASGDIENSTMINGQDAWTFYNLTAPNRSAWRTQAYEPGNDDSNPNHFNCPDGTLISCVGSFPMAGMDYAYDNYLTGMQALVAANGETFHIIFQWVHWPSSPTWLESTPDEVGEHILAAFSHIRNKYGAALVPDILDIMVEPDLHCNGSVPTAFCGQGGVWDPTKLGQALVAVKSRLNSAGFDPKFWCCSVTRTSDAVYWYSGVKAAGFTPDSLTTHWYDFNNTSHFPALIGQASADNIPLVMTELDYMGIGGMYNLITAGNMSGVEKYGPASINTTSSTDNASDLLTITSTSPYASRYVGNANGATYTWFFPQVWKYARDGDVREQAVSDNSSFLPLAFRSPSGIDKIPILINVTGTQTVHVTGVAPGTYGCTYTYSNNVLLQPCGPSQTIAAGGTLTATLTNIPAAPPSSATAAVVTFYGIPPQSMPAIHQNGVVPLYSTTPVIQPGSWISIYGNNLAPAPASWTGNFPNQLGGVTVTIDKKPAYLWYVSPGQINLQAPDDTTTGLVSVVVNTPNGTTTSTVTLAPYGPSLSLLGDNKHVLAEIPTPNGNGAYGGYDLDGPTGAFPFSTRPVNPGETLVLFGVGFGPTTSAVAAGKPFSGAVSTNTPVTVTIGGVPAPVAFAGLIEAGLYQINVTVPNGIPAGDQPIEAVVNGIGSPAGLVVTVQ